MLKTDIFTNDWFPFRNENQTFSGKRIGINWEGDENKPLCSFLYEEEEIEDMWNNEVLMKNELQNIGNSIIRNVQLVMDPKSDTSHTNGHTVTLSTSPIRKTAKNNAGEGLDSMIGVLIHEYCHCKYTDFSVFGKNYHNPRKTQIIMWVSNLLEDEVIENMMGYERPGYAKFVTKTKLAYFNNRKDIKSTFVKAKTDIDRVMQLFLYCVRAPKCLKELPESMMEQYEDILNRIKDVLFTCDLLELRIPKYNEPDTLLNSPTKDTLRAAEMIYNILCNDAEEEYEKADQDYLTKGDKGSKGGHSVAIAVPGSGNSSSEDGGGNQGTEGQKDDNDDNEDNNSDTVTVVIDGLGDSKGESDDPEEYDKEIERIKNEFGDKGDIDDIKPNNKKSVFNSGSSDETGLPNEILSGATKNTNLIPIPKRENRHLYNEIVKTYKSQIREAKNIITYNKKADIIEKKTFMRNGTLDSRRLAEALSGVNTVYQQLNTKQVKKDAKYAFVIAIDESGSMGGDEAYKVATRLAVILYEAVKTYPNIELYVYGHNDRVRAYITKYNKWNPAVITGRFGAGGGQNEEKSYMRILEDVRKQTKLPILFMNITDCLYLCSERDMLMINEYQEKYNCEFNIIGISHGYTPDWFSDNKAGQQIAKLNNEIYGEKGWFFHFNNSSQGYSDTVRKLAKTMKIHLDMLNKRNKN